MSHLIRSQAVLERSSLLIERAGPLSARFLRDLLRQVRRARIPRLEVEIGQVRLGGMLSPARPFLVARPGRFRDVRYYVGAQPLGMSLEVLSVVAVEPGTLKRLMAWTVHRGAWWSWSLPQAIDGSEELRSFLTFVEAGTQEVARRISARASGGGGELSGEGGSVLEQWR